MTLAIIAIMLGLALLIWSAGKLVDGSIIVASLIGMPPILIGMIIIGFGTSAPELLVSSIASIQANPGLALGNAFGSNISNIALILGVTALIKPIMVQSQVLRKELPILCAVTLLASALLFDGRLVRLEAFFLLLLFVALMAWAIWQSKKATNDTFSQEIQHGLEASQSNVRSAWVWVATGLVILIASSQILVWGATEVARRMGLSNLVIGLTIVAIGTSLPEFASSVIAARKGEHDIALGNILGSNLFNTLAVVGLAGSIHPLVLDPQSIRLELFLMIALTLSLFVLGYGFRRQGQINRFEGAGLVVCYLIYLTRLLANS